MQHIDQFVLTRRAAGLLFGAAICGAASAGANATLPPVGMYIWYDQPVWCAVDWPSSNPCMDDGIYKWNANYLCDSSQDAYESV
ncbi:MAG: hypothetical protein HOL13_00010, partial [Phycisphaerae bacterium]|nr:hypothetical protein [Phycisphaerae bacterium]